MDTILSRLPDPILGVLASTMIFWQYTVRPALGRLVRLAVYVLFMPFFGVGGSHFMTATSYRDNKHRINWMAYSVLTRVLLIQVHKGKTVYTYSIQDVGPMTYLAIMNDPSTPNMQEVLETNPKYEVRWTWRYDGVYRKGIDRPNHRFPTAPRRPGQRRPSL